MAGNRSRWLACAGGVLTGLAGALALKKGIQTLTGAKRVMERQEKNIADLEAYYCLFEHWIDRKQKGRNLEDYFVSNHMEEIAVYGMAQPGTLLCNELKDSVAVNVRYGMDRNFSARNSVVPMQSLSDDVIPVDAVIVTPITSFQAIRSELEKKFECPVVSLEDVIYDL